MLPKPGKDATNVKNYRPITLFNTVGKAFEKILATRIKRTAVEQALLSANQYRFREKRSTTDALLRLQTDIVSSTYYNGYANALFLDVERAFDRVWQDALIIKLLEQGYTKNIVKLISSFLSGRISRTSYQNTLFDSFTTEAGTPQGSILSPLLFTADIPKPTQTNTHLSLFADDTAIWSKGPLIETNQRRLQKFTKRIEQWANKWRIKINAEKSQAIVFHHPSKRPRHNWLPNRITIEDKTVPYTKTVTYLGVKWIENTTMDEYVENVKQKMRKRVRLIAAIRGKLRGCSQHTLLHTYKTYVRPIMDYRAPLLSDIDEKKTEY